MGKIFKMLFPVLIFRPLIRAFAALSVVVWVICMLDLLFLDHFRRAVYVIPLCWIMWSMYKYHVKSKESPEEKVI